MNELFRHDFETPNDVRACRVEVVVRRTEGDEERIVDEFRERLLSLSIFLYMYILSYYTGQPMTRLVVMSNRSIVPWFHKSTVEAKTAS